MRNTYESNWWFIQLPPEWQWQEDEDCVGFFADDSVGALQVSAYLKEGAVVNNEDLQDFIPEEIQQAVLSMPVQIGDFSGYNIAYVDQGVYWRQWWLKTGQVLVHLTYNADVAYRGVEDDVIDGIVSTLKAKAV